MYGTNPQATITEGGQKSKKGCTEAVFEALTGKLVTPAELFLKRKPRTKFSVLKPNTEMHIQNQQGKLQQQHDKSSVKMHELSSRDSVNERNTRGGVKKWVPGTVIRRLGPLTYLLKVGRQLH